MHKILLILLLLALPVYSQVMSFVAPAETSFDVEDGLIAFWPMDETSGTRYDAIGDYDLTESGTSIGYGTGVISNAIDYEATGTSGYLYYSPDTPFDMPNKTFTLSLWVRVESFTSTYFVLLMGQYDATGAKREYGLFLDCGTKSFDFRTADGTTSAAAKTANNSVSLETWYCVTGWYNAATDSVYLRVNDGAVIRAYSTTGASDLANDFILGLNPTSGSYELDGMIDNAGFWDNKCPVSGDNWRLSTELYNGGDGWAPE